MAEARLLISSRNYSSWSLRGWLLTRLAGLDTEVVQVDWDADAAKAELLLKSSSILVPCLFHDGLEIWDTSAIAGYLDETFPQAGMWPVEKIARARCRSISGEMHSGFAAVRAALPMNLRHVRKNFVVWSEARADIDRICAIWRDCLQRWGGPFLFGTRMTIGDVMYAPMATRFRSYDVKLDAACDAYAAYILALPDMLTWRTLALAEKEEVEELEIEF